MHSSHSHQKRKRDDIVDDDESPLLVSRVDFARSNPNSRSHHFSHHDDSHRPSSSSRSTYDIGRDSPSSRHREEDEWRTSDSSRDRYSFSSSKDAYHRSRDGYDVTEPRDDGWSSRTLSDTHYTASSREWTQRYDPSYVSSSYPESSWSASSSYDRTSSHEQWPAEDSRAHSRSAVDDRTPDRGPGWRRDGRRKGDRGWVGDSGWETRQESWEENRTWTSAKNEDTTRSTADRTWEPAASWQSSSRGEQQGQRHQNHSRSSHSGKSRGKRSSHNHSKPQKSHWRGDDGGLNNWQKRDSQNYSSKGLRSTKKRKQPRSPSRSRSPSPVESYHSRRSSHERSHSRSISPKRRRHASPVTVTSDRGRSHKRDRKSSRSPGSNKGDRRSRRRSPSSVSSRSRSSSRSPTDRPRAVHRLPTATSFKDLSFAKSQSRNSNLLTRDAGSYRNGKTQINGKHNPLSHNEHPSFTSGKNPSTESMPPPTTIPAAKSNAIASSKPISIDDRASIPSQKSNRSVNKGAGFRPIGQASSAVKKFFPADDYDDDDHDERKDRRRPDATPPALVGAAFAQDPSSELTAESEQMPVDGIDRKAHHSPPSPFRQDVVVDTNAKQDGPELLSSPSRRELLREDAASSTLETRINEDSETQARHHGAHDNAAVSPASQSELYKIINQVGEGTFGKVYKAQNTITGLHVALKRIRMESERDGFPVTAMREIKLLQSLRHRNVVRLYEMMVSNVNVYMVFEYMDHDLTGILSQTQFSFTDAHLKSLCLQMLAGLAYLHQRGVIHRDIKGSNILINNKGELKLADFGLARFYQKRRRSDYTNRVITIWYRPPELLFGATVYGPEVDMWSAGCIMLELFTKKPVFQGNDEIHQLDVIYKILGTPNAERWPGVLDLPWYELVRPKEDIANRFRELFQKWLSPAALDLAEQLLLFDPTRRITALQAMETPYFRVEEPAPCKPTELCNLEGEWHELETKRERAKKRRRNEVEPQ